MNIRKKRDVQEIMRELTAAVPKDGTLVCIYAGPDGEIRKVIGGRKDYILAMAYEAMHEVYGRKED